MLKMKSNKDDVIISKLYTIDLTNEISDKMINNITIFQWANNSQVSGSNPINGESFKKKYMVPD